MRRKKTSDPRLIALLDRREKAQADFERAYGRLARAFNRMHKARKRLGRLNRQVCDYEASPKGGATCPA